MKTKLLILALLFVVDLQAQKSVVKWSPTARYFNSYSFQWEQRIGRNSVVLDIGIPINQNIAGRLGVKNDDYQFTKFGTESVRVGFRHYTSKVREFGLYLEPYFKEQTLRTKDIMPQPNNSIINAYLYTTNIGFQLGYQWLIKKHFVIDLYFLGLEYGRANGRIKTVSSDHEGAIYMDKYIHDNGDKYLPRYINNKLITTVDGKEVEGRLDNFFYPWLRSGFSIGYKF